VLVCQYGEKYISRHDLLTCILIIFYSDLFDKVDNFTFTVLRSIAVSVFDLGMSFGKVKPG